MLSYAIKRFLQGTLIIIAVSMAAFMMISLMPGDPMDSLVSEKMSDVKREELREKWGFNKPLPVRYWNWASRVIKGDMGTSLRTNLDILESLRARMPISVKLCGIAMVIGVFIAVPLGLLAAYKQGGKFDRFVMGYSMVTAAIPTFWIGIVLILIFAVFLRLLPANGFSGTKHYILPVTAMVLGGLSGNIRLTRSEVLGVIREKYILTAYAKGLNKNAVMFKHVLRNALILIVVSVFMSLPWIVAGAFIMENLFSMPGMGALLTNAVLHGDFPVVQACLLVISALVVASNIVGDICIALLDPRIRVSISGGGL